MSHQQRSIIIFFVNFPSVNVSGMHWAVVVIHMTEKRIQFYDSLSGRGNQYLEGLMQYLKDMAKKGCPLPDADEWVLVESTPDTPQQLNGFECGVFMCMFCDFLSMGYPLTFTQEHITRCRQLIALSIMNGVRSPSDPSSPPSPSPSRSSRCVPELARTLYGEAGGTMPLTDLVVMSISAVEGRIGSGDISVRYYPDLTQGKDGDIETAGGCAALSAALCCCFLHSDGFSRSHTKITMERGRHILSQHRASVGNECNEMDPINAMEYLRDSFSEYAAYGYVGGESGSIDNEQSTSKILRMMTKDGLNSIGTLTSGGHTTTIAYVSDAGRFLLVDTAKPSHPPECLIANYAFSINFPASISVFPLVLMFARASRLPKDDSLLNQIQAERTSLTYRFDLWGRPEAQVLAQPVTSTSGDLSHPSSTADVAGVDENEINNKFTSIVDTLHENRHKIKQLDETALAEYEKGVCRDHDLAYAQYLETCELVRHKPCLFPPIVLESFSRLIRIEEMIMWHREKKLKQHQEQILQLEHDLEVAKEEKQAAEKDADRRLKAELIDQKRDLETSFKAERNDIELRYQAELDRAAKDHHESTKDMLENHNREMAILQERTNSTIETEQAIAKDQKKTSDAYIGELEKQQMEYLRQIRQLEAEKKRMPSSSVRIVLLPSNATIVFPLF